MYIAALPSPNTDRKRDEVDSAGAGTEGGPEFTPGVSGIYAGGWSGPTGIAALRCIRWLQS